MMLRKLKDFEIFENNEFLNEIKLNKDNIFSYSEFYNDSDNEYLILSDFYYTNENNEKIKVSVGCYLIDSKDIIVNKTPLEPNRNLYNYSFKNEYVMNNILVVDFQEHDFYDEKYIDKNSSDNRFIFKKLNTIMNIILKICKIKNCDFILIKPAENDVESGKNRLYNKRDRLYRLYFDYFNFNYHYYNTNFILNNQNNVYYLSNFYIVKIN